MLTHSVPIESQFVASLPDNLNAEVVLGTVSNVREAVQWLGCASPRPALALPRGRHRRLFD